MDNSEKEFKDKLFSELPKAYSNSVKISFTYYDFQLVFSTLADNNLVEGSEGTIQHRFLVQTSPQHYKALVEIMNNTLQEYEKRFGEILPLPKMPKRQAKTKTKSK